MQYENLHVEAQITIILIFESNRVQRGIDITLPDTFILLTIPSQRRKMLVVQVTVSGVIVSNPTRLYRF